MNSASVGDAFRGSSALHRLSRFTSLFAFLVLFAGGMVTSTGSGLAVPDWPMSMGQYMPAMIGGVFFEHGHRMVAGIVAVLTAILTGWVLLREPRRWIRRVAVAASVGVIVQAVLGGVTVLYGLPPEVSILHACLGQGLFCALAVIAQATAPGYLAVSQKPGGRLWRWGLLAAGAVFFQLILGAIMRHANVGLVLHMAWALAAVAAVCYAGYRGIGTGPRELSLGGLSCLMVGMTLVQIFLGFGALWARTARVIAVSSLLPTAHQACGALVLVATLLWTLRAYRSAA